MNKLEIEIGRPHYIKRNQQFDKKDIDKSIKVKIQKKKQIPKTKVRTKIIKNHQQDFQKIKSLKQWLLNLIRQAKQNWQQELLAKQNSIILMKKDHKDKLLKILKYIEDLRKKAYEKYKHNCDKPKGEGCNACQQRRVFFHDLVSGYLSGKKGTNISSKRDSITRLKPQKTEKSRRSRESESKISDIQRSLKSRTLNHSRASSLSNRSRSSINSLQSRENDQRSKNAPYSKFKKTERQYISRKNVKNDSSDTSNHKRSNQSRQSVGSIPTQKKLQYEARHNRYKKSVLYNPQQNSNNKGDEYSSKMDESLKRSSKNSIRQSILKTSRVYHDEYGRAFSKIIDSDDANHKKKISLNSRMNKFSFIHNNENFELSSELPQRKRRTVKGRNNKFKKNENNGDVVDVQVSQPSEKSSSPKKRQRDEIEELIKEKQFHKNENFKKISRYRRERMFYDVLKKQILTGVEQATQTQHEVNKIRHQSQASSSNDQLSIKEDQKVDINFENKCKKYSLAERKESLLSKLALLNDGNHFQNLKGKFQQVLNKNMSLVRDQDGQKTSKIIIQKFLSQVLKIKDLKRLMKDKFIKQSDWSPKMREMHQFYTYLQYSMSAFRSKLSKITNLGWKQLSFEGKSAQTKLDNLILDSKIKQWQGLDLSNLGQDHHREIQCSMKYYGIDIKRQKNLNQINYEVSQDRTLNPIFSSVGQRSMREIKQLTENLLIF